MASAKWIKGKGIKAAAGSGSASTRIVVRAEAKEDAAKRIGAVVARVTENDQDKQIISAIVRRSKGGTSEDILSVSDIAADAGVTMTYARFFLKTKRAQLDPLGIVIKKVTSASFSVSISPGGRSSTPSPAAKAKRTRKVAAAKKKEEKPELKLDEDFFHFDKTVEIKIRAAIKTGLNVWLAGETGTGKSEYFERILESIGSEFFKVSFNGESSAADLLGHYELRGKETVWVEGALGEAAQKGIPLICEEIDAAPAEANLVMQRALERRHGKPRRFYNPINGKDYEASLGFIILATANSTGGGDHSGLYAGLQVQNAAFRDRFIFESITYMKPTHEVKVLIKRTGIARQLAERAVEFANAARQAVANQEIFTPVSTRTLLGFADFLSALEEEGMARNHAVREAMLSACIHKSGSPSDKEALRGMVQRIFGA